MQARLLFLLVAFTGLGLGRVLAQQGGNALYSTHGSQPDYHAVQQAPLNHERLDDNSLLINANIISNVAASSYVAIFSVTQYGRTASETDSLLNLRLQAASAALQAMGVPKTDTHVDIISLVPTYAVKLEQKKFSRTANEVPTGFELKKNLHVIYTDDALLDRMVTSLARAEIYDLVKVDYNVAALQAAYDSLRLAGVAVVKRKEAEYARLGLHLEVQNMTDNFQAVYPLERYASYVAAHTGSSLEEVRLARQQQAANVYVSSRNATINVRPAPREEPILLRTADKQRTIYYNRTPYSSYDLVLHPDVAEPRVQLIYTMAVKYQVLNQQRYEEQEADRLRQREKAERDDKDARKARRKNKKA